MGRTRDKLAAELRKVAAMASPANAEKIWKDAETAKAERAKAMPTVQDAIDAMQEAYQRLRDLGWRDAIYCPKD